MLDIFYKKEGGQLVNQHPGLTTARPCCNNNMLCFSVINDFQLGRRELSEQLVELVRCQGTGDLPLSVPEILVQE